MPWRCPACSTPIRPQLLDAGDDAPHPGRLYRCQVCRLEFGAERRRDSDGRRAARRGTAPVRRSPQATVDPRMQPCRIESRKRTRSATAPCAEDELDGLLVKADTLQTEATGLTRQASASRLLTSRRHAVATPHRPTARIGATLSVISAPRAGTAVVVTVPGRVISAGRQWVLPQGSGQAFSGDPQLIEFVQFLERSVRKDRSPKMRRRRHSLE